jgi:hypothetical protein
MDYTYPEKETVKLDCKTERTICESNRNLIKIIKQLDELNHKVDALANKGKLES